MDKAVKAALNKYLGREGKSNTRGSDGFSIVNVLLIVLIISTVLLISVRLNFLGIGTFWENIKSKSVGNKTVGQIIENAREKMDDFFTIEIRETDNTAQTESSGSNDGDDNHTTEEVD